MTGAGVKDGVTGCALFLLGAGATALGAFGITGFVFPFDLLAAFPFVFGIVVLWTCCLAIGDDFWESQR